jgi:hypothetical protein
MQSRHQTWSDVTETRLTREFDRQLNCLLELRYPALAGLGGEEFLGLMAALRKQVEELSEDLDDGQEPAADSVPFVIVVRNALVSTTDAMAAATLNDKPGFVSADLQDVDTFTPRVGVDGVLVPDAPVYLAVGVERGDEYLNWTPDEAVPKILGRERSPLTVDEGIALLTHFPQLIEKNRCTMTAASRCGDRRVPAIWISGGTGKDGKERRGAPKLGWCWAGNRHTWLGIGSVAARVAAELPAQSAGAA